MIWILLLGLVVFVKRLNKLAHVKMEKYNAGK
jgi:hypothetical protein